MNLQTEKNCTKIIYLKGLDCPGCAGKIEEAVKNIAGVEDAALDFVTQRLTIRVTDAQSAPATLREAAEVALSIEPDIKISYSAPPREEKNTRARLPLVGLILSLAFFAAGLILSLPQIWEFSLFFISFLLAGGGVIIKALRNIARGRVFDENFLMLIATAGAFAIGEYPEGAAVMLFYQVGELLQDAAVNRSRRSISALMDIRPDYANLREGTELRRVSPEEVGVGDIIVVRPGERIPLDGIVSVGASSLDTSALTGESLPRDVGFGDEVYSGSVNQNGVLEIRVTKEFGESTVSKILELVQNASSQKSPTENFITKFARYYTPAVVFLALALAFLPPLIIPGAALAECVRRALIFLVVSCPCALVVSIPLSFFGGIGCASKRGILIKGSNYLEALNSVHTVVFDKTGTLTKGSFKVAKINTANGFSRDELLNYAAHAENYSSHPIAESIRAAYGKTPDTSRISDCEEISGHGINVKIDGKQILAGNAALMRREGIKIKVESDGEETLGSVVHIAVGSVYAGSIVITDEIKPDSAEAIARLKSAGILRIVMLTGDTEVVGEAVGRELGIDRVYAGLLPADKVTRLEELIKDTPPGKKVLFVGDGINDAPVLARADIGIAMGAQGADAAIEAADIVLMTDEPSRLADALGIAKRTRTIVWQNIIFALGIKLIFMILGTLGVATMWEAVFGDVGVTVIAVINAARAQKYSGYIVN